MKMILLGPIVCFTALLSGCATENQPDNSPDSVASESKASRSKGGLSDSEIVQRDIRKLYKALYGSDFDTVLSFTHPKVIALMGGREKAKKTLEANPIKMKLESLDFPDSPTFIKTDLNRFVFVPTKVIVSKNGQRIESLNFQFGIQRIGTEDWKYMEGSRINNENVRSIFPDFPRGYEFPEFYRKKL